MFTYSGAEADIEKIKSNQRRRELRGARLEENVFREFLCDGQLRRRELKSVQKRAKPKDDISQYGQYYLNPAKWSLQSGTKSELNIQEEEERISKSQRDLALDPQSVGYLTSTKAFIQFCKATNRFREVEFLKKFT